MTSSGGRLIGASTYRTSQIIAEAKAAALSVLHEDHPKGLTPLGKAFWVRHRELQQRPAR